MLFSSPRAHTEVYFSKPVLGLGLALFFSESVSLVSFLVSLGITAPTRHLHRGPCPYLCLWGTELNDIRVRRASMKKGPLIPHQSASIPSHSPQPAAQGQPRLHPVSLSSAGALD